MPCFVLDLDGTMMPSHKVDNECYWQAVGEVFEVSRETRTLEGFSNVTDNGILGEWAQRHLGRDPNGDETRAVQEVFLGLLEQAAQHDAAAFTPTDGLEAWLQCCANNNWPVAIATGGWRNTALFKLRASGLDRFALPLAGSDDAIDRAGIMQLAVQALPAGGTNPPGTITYIGDGPWDFVAAQHLGWEFIGIASQERARQLRDRGAQRVLQDFLPLLEDCAGMQRH